MILTYVLAKHVPTKISGKIPPCSMDVVGSVLRVGVFKQEARALDAIIVRLKLLHASRPGKTNFIQAAFFYLGPVFLGDHRAVAVEVLLDESCKQHLLVLLELAECNAGLVERLHLGQRGG